MALQYNTAEKTDSGIVSLLIDGLSYSLPYSSTPNKNTIKSLNIPSITLSEGNHTIELKLENYNGKQAMQPMQLLLIPTLNK